MWIAAYVAEAQWLSGSISTNQRRCMAAAKRDKRSQKAAFISGFLSLLIPRLVRITLWPMQ